MAKQTVRLVLAGTIFALALSARCPVEAGELYWPFKVAAEPVRAMHRTPPETGKDCSIEQLAEEIDWLEHHIDKYGSIVAKHPDVWGESRLMRHRYEYEEQMAAQLGRFEVRMNAALRRSDQSFLGMAMALQAAAGTRPGEGGNSTPTGIPSVPTAKNDLQIVNGLVSNPTAEPLDGEAQTMFRTAPFGLTNGDTYKPVPGFSYEQNQLSLEPTIQLDQMSRYLNHLHELRRINEGDDIADSPGYSLNLVRIPVSILPGKQTRKGYGAEITVIAEPHLSPDLLPITFRDLVINDLVDQLAYPMTRVINSRSEDITKYLDECATRHFYASIGYSPKDRPAQPPAQVVDHTIWEMNLAMRDAPKTENGEVSMWDYEDTMIEDLKAESVSIRKIAKTAWHHAEYAKMAAEAGRTKEAAEAAGKVNGAAQVLKTKLSALERTLTQAMVEEQEAKTAAEAAMSAAEKAAEDAAAAEGAAEEETATTAEDSADEVAKKKAAAAKKEAEARSEAYAAAEKRSSDTEWLIKRTRKAVDVLDEKAKISLQATILGETDVQTLGNSNSLFAKAFEMELGITAFHFPVTRSRGTRLPIPATQLLATYDAQLLAHPAADALSGLRTHDVSNKTLHLMDVRQFLQSELHAAYEFLSAENNKWIWERREFISELARAVRENDQSTIRELRDHYLTGVGIKNPEKRLETADTTRALAWAILVESALLNERLIQDMKETATAHGEPSSHIDKLSFYGPEPIKQARDAFNRYVSLRWPIRVFALDPVTQDQNIADAFARRRELQVAMALAFAGGQMNAQSLMRFNRRLEWDMATIDLNRTVVGFSHANDTFGWRFHPRFQTPPIKGTIATFGETLLGGPSEESDLRQRELEPGQRECTAIVVMPSFVPQVVFDVRTNWFSLTHPKQTEVSMKDTMELSRSITAMKNSAAQCAECQHLYREGEVPRLLRRVDQLDRELPLQTMYAQVPYENTAGGFELFNHGITDLAPELLGWYGAPGVNPRSGTTMYLVGEAFSVHGTRLIAGGRVVPFRLISRQLMEVQIPAGVQTLDTAAYDEVVDVHLATPYGVSSHLLIPVAPPEAQLPGPASELSFAPNRNVKLFFNRSDAAKTVSFENHYQADELVIIAPRGAAPPMKADIVFYASHTNSGGETVNLGSFKVDGIPLDPGTNQYYFPKDMLATLVGANDTAGLRGLADPYLEYLFKKDEKLDQSYRIDVGCRLLDESERLIPISGGFTVTLEDMKP